jgi:hypothetical protein
MRTGCTYLVKGFRLFLELIEDVGIVPLLLGAQLVEILLWFGHDRLLLIVGVFLGGKAKGLKIAMSFSVDLDLTSNEEPQLI